MSVISAPLQSWLKSGRGVESLGRRVVNEHSCATPSLRNLRHGGNPHVNPPASQGGHGGQLYHQLQKDREEKLGHLKRVKEKWM